MYRSYRDKLLLLLLLVVFFVLTVVTAYTFYGSAKAAKENSIRLAGQELRQILDNVDYYLRDGENIARTTAIEPAVQEALADPLLLHGDRLLSASYRLKDVYTKYLSSRPYVKRIFVVAARGTILEPELAGYEKEALATLEYGRFWESGEKVSFQYNPAPFYVNARPAVSCIKKIYDISTAQPVGAVVVDIDSSVLPQGSNVLEPSQRYNLTLTDAQGRAALKKEPVEPRDHSRIVLDAVSDYSGWRLTMVLDSESIGFGGETVLAQLLLLLALCLLAALAAIRIIINRTYLPVLNLVRAMQRVESGQFGARAEVRGDDEFAFLAQKFNDMSSRLGELMNRLVSEEKLKKEAELYALQAQINPHFLYNTLNAIRFVAKTHEDEETAALVGDLIALFQSSVGSVGDLLPLREELRLTLCYAHIMEARYGSIFTVLVDLPEELEKLALPRFTIQPLVENAIFHGLSPKGGGTIRIAASPLAGNVVIRISDDGAGIPPERLCEITAALGSEKEPRMQGRHLGLKNVHIRLKMSFGPAYGLSVNSFVHTGTIVTVTVPQEECVCRRLPS